jgi:sulfoxide reductase heme-binding subunit YedZ
VRYNCHAIAAGRNLSSINDEHVLADLVRPARAAIAAAHGRACFTAISARQKGLVDAQSIVHGARPLNDLIHRSDFWALVFLGVTLAVTPLRRIARYGNLIDVRRMLGVGAFCYIATHLTLFTASQMFDIAKVAHEISHRWYLIIGGTAWLGLVTLAATSTDGMVRQLGGLRWRRLHQIVYGIALLALVHYFQQTKADVTVPIFAASLFLWLIAYRLVAWWQDSSELSTLTLLGLSIAVSVLTLYRRGGRHRHRLPYLADACTRRGVRFFRRHQAGLAGASRGPCRGRD